MPSPVGHSLIGLAIGSAWLLKPAALRELVRDAWSKRWPLLGAVALANAPDVDYIPGVLTGDINAYHHYYTHTAGWILIVAAGTWLAWRSLRSDAGWRAFLFLAALLSSHLAADWVTDDGKSPYGIMAMWPFSPEFTIAPATLFVRLHKVTWYEIFEWHNVEAVAIEIAICLPLVAAVLMWKRVRARDPA
jgi:membrane-bound metal-dependent hydrolase YbcI (DUF457 family)